MPRKLKPLILLAVVLVLSACVSQPIKLQGGQTTHQGLVTQSVTFTRQQQQYQWVCYTELVQQLITALSCQNDTALPLFSGGLVAGEFEFNYASRLLLKIQPQNMLAYIKMSLFDGLHIDSRQIKVQKQAGYTHITDSKRKLKLTIQAL